MFIRPLMDTFGWRNYGKGRPWLTWALQNRCHRLHRRQVRPSSVNSDRNLKEPMLAAMSSRIHGDFQAKQVRQSYIRYFFIHDDNTSARMLIRSEWDLSPVYLTGSISYRYRDGRLSCAHWISKFRLFWLFEIGFNQPLVAAVYWLAGVAQTASDWTTNNIWAYVTDWHLRIGQLTDYQTKQ